jgi:peptidylprolyl isomerase
LRVLRLRRPAALTSAVLISLATLSACGDDPAPEESAAGFDAVTVSGPVGETPEIEWNAMLDSGEKQVEVVEEGDGVAVANGDKVLVNYAISDEYTQSINLETYGEDQPALSVEVGAKDLPPAAPADLITDLLVEAIEPGMRTGTRIAMTVDAAKEWSDPALEPYVLQLAQVGLGNEDGFVLVADLEAVPLAGPEGKSKPAPAWAPRIVQSKGKPTSLDSSGLPAPDPKAKTISKATLIQGTGPVVEKGDQLVAHYIGQVHGGDKPFDESYSGGEPRDFPIGIGQVVKGWDRGLVGVPVGSRVLLRIPPTLGYGKQGNPQAGIKGTDTLYFVVDVLAAA